MIRKTLKQQVIHGVVQGLWIGSLISVAMIAVIGLVFIFAILPGAQP